MCCMGELADRLPATGEFLSEQVLAPEGTSDRSGGPGQPPDVDGGPLESKDLIAGWMAIDVADFDRAVEIAGELSAASGAGGSYGAGWALRDSNPRPAD